jgi:hypothetical protein
MHITAYGMLYSVFAKYHYPCYYVGDKGTGSSVGGHYASISEATLEDYDCIGTVVSKGGTYRRMRHDTSLGNPSPCQLYLKIIYHIITTCPALDRLVVCASHQAGQCR